MKVLFILPRLEPNTNPPLGLGYVAIKKNLAKLKKNRY